MDDRFRDFLLFACVVGAVASMLLCAFQAFNGKIGAAALLGTLFVVCSLFAYFPRLELLKVWGMEARLTQTLNRAEEIIAKMKELSASTARANYMLMAWGNRMGTPSAVERQAVMDQVDRQLSGLEIPQSERIAIARPYVRMIGFDLHYWAVRLFDRYINWKDQELGRKYGTNPSEEQRKERQDYSFALGAWRLALAVTPRCSW